MKTTKYNQVTLLFSPNPEFHGANDINLGKGWTYKCVGKEPSGSETVTIPLQDPSIDNHHFSLINNGDGVYIVPLSENGVYKRIKVEERADISKNPDLYLGNTRVVVANNAGNLTLNCTYRGAQSTVQVPPNQSEMLFLGRLFFQTIMGYELNDDSMGAINSRLIIKRHSIEVHDIGTSTRGSSNGTWVRVPHKKVMKVHNSAQFKFGDKAYMKIKISKITEIESAQTVKILRCFREGCEMHDASVSKFPFCTNECDLATCIEHKIECLDRIAENMACPKCHKALVVQRACIVEGCKNPVVEQKSEVCKKWCTFGACSVHLANNEAFLLLNKPEWASCKFCKKQIIMTERNKWRIRKM